MKEVAGATALMLDASGLKTSPKQAYLHKLKLKSKQA